VVVTVLLANRHCEENSRFSLSFY